MQRTQLEEITLIKYRDAGMATYTYFWKNSEGKIVSPFFDSEDEAHTWLEMERK